MIKKFGKYINEGVRDKMTPKSEEDIKEILKNISPERLMKISVYDTNDLDGVKEALKRGFNPSKNKNSFLEGMIMSDHYDENMIDILKSYGGVLAKSSELTDRWFICNCLNDTEEEQEVLFEFYKEVLKLFLSDERVLKNMTAMEIMGYRSLLRLT